MNLQLLTNGLLIIQGNLWYVIGISILVLGILIMLSIFIFRTLNQNEKLKYEFITIIAHKFRTPLTQIRWIAEGLTTDETDPYKKESLNDIKQSNEKLIKLTNSLLEITDSDSAARASYIFAPISLCEVVKNVGESYKKMFHEKNLFFSVSCPPEDVKVRADKDRLEFVIQSLLENAYAYTSPGMNVDVSVSQIHRKATVAVTDHGIGIDQKDIPQIFTKFFRSEAARRADTEGFGISLFLSKAIMRRHKGKIEVSSAGLGNGSTFKISLKAV